MLHEQRVGVEKFAIVGTASAGKSTLTEIYKERYKDNPQVIVLEEATQIFFQSHPEIVQGAIHIYDIQRQIQDFVLSREQTAYRPGIKLIISDRSVIDPIIYTQHYQSSEDATMLMGRVTHWIPTYRKFFLLDPTTVPYEAGVFRREKAEDRLAVHIAFEKFLQLHNLPYELISGSIDERIEQINLIISRYYGTR